MPGVPHLRPQGGPGHRQVQPALPQRDNLRPVWADVQVVVPGGLRQVRAVLQCPAAGQLSGTEPGL